MDNQRATFLSVPKFFPLIILFNRGKVKFYILGSTVSILVKRVENGDRQEKSFERTSKNLLDHFFFAIDHLKVSALIFPQENIAKKCPG
ncbi:MAG: hypothetical protein QG657_5801 [Acidobacteriota bacterium]|nr:hypothetical protein [Acidobacteriota bacterium]